MIVALAGGVGAAKFITGLVHEIDPEELCIIINTGDDITLFGLEISPDLDIIMYTLAEIVNPTSGWGISEDTFNCLEMFRKYKIDTWFQLGDRDLATHILRTQMLREGRTLTEITREFCNRLSIKTRLFPMSNQKVPTKIRTPEGVIHFEEYMIKRKSEDRVLEIIYEGIEKAIPPPGLKTIIKEAEGFIICPSNPLVSIGPILQIPGMKKAIQEANKPVVGISPLIGDAPVKGPLGRMMKGLQLEVSSLSVARLYQDLVKTFIIDKSDQNQISSIKELGIDVVATNTLMEDLTIKRSLARMVLDVIRR